MSANARNEELLRGMLDEIVKQSPTFCDAIRKAHLAARTGEEIARWHDALNAMAGITMIARRLQERRT